MKYLLLATNNLNKVKEMQSFFKDYDITLLSLKDVNIISNPEENGTSFKENAFIKARDVALKTNYPVLSDDSGLMIHALNGFPGIYSSRFMLGKSYQEKCEAILEMMKAQEDKSASFICNLCLMNLKDEPLYFEGRHDGKIVPLDGKGGFGYDPIFYSNEKKMTFAKLPIEEKNLISHRGRALKSLITYLENNKFLDKKR